ncbi:tetratricopeptide repeat protein [Myroides sp. DF42-4-2]|uniref:tetratricopeptide repeat protein n=1 Tax=unclassified Myroides TaxID=2642485 RepID=UPI002576F532|nr:tetratricopeptide repeat protein [Myroides sp. DF42-4-2]MDM1408002.1 tetratricopeptide repeat protein [Myroides sp. DF42-4-2]
MKKLLYLFMLSLLFSCTPSTEHTSNQINLLLADLNKIDDLVNLEEVVAAKPAKAYDLNKNMFSTIVKIKRAQIKSKELGAFNEQSTLLFKEVEEQLETINFPNLTHWAYTQIGFYYYTYNYYVESANYYSKVTIALDHNPEQITIQATDIYRKIGYFYGTIGKAKQGITYLTKALQLTTKDNINYTSLLNAIGNFAIKDKQEALAYPYLIQAKNISESQGDLLRYAKVLGDLATIENNKQNWEKAISYLEEDIAISKKVDDKKNTMFALLSLAQVYWDKSDIPMAKKTALEAFSYTQSLNYVKGFEYQIMHLLLEIAIYEKDEKRELLYRRNLTTLHEYINETEGQKAIDQINWDAEIELINLQLEAQRYHYEKINYQRLLFISISFSLGCILVFLYRVYRTQLSKQASIYESNILKIEQEMAESEKRWQDTNHSLDSYKEYLAEKTKQINILEIELNKLKDSTSVKSQTERMKLEQTISSHLMTDESWLIFKKTFQNEQREYFENLMQQFPELTDSNLRVVLLQKLNLTNQETANILGITIEAVKKTKQRLKKKYRDTYDQLFN